MNYIKNKYLLLLVLLLLTLLSVTGCGNDRKTSNQIVIGEHADLGGYDPASTMSPFVRSLVFNSLVELDADFKLVPALAESWQMSADGKEWVFKLRDNVKFHDGTPLTAEVVKQNFQRLKTAPAAKVWLLDLQDISVVNKNTVKFVMVRPAFTFAADIAVPIMSIVAPAALDEKGVATKAIGTGPFALASWNKGQEFVMTANQSYWGGAPKVDKLVFKVITDPESRAMALESGAVDFISLRQSLTAAGRLAKNNNIKLDKRLGQTSEIMFFNLQSPALQNLAVRKAVAQAINIESMIKNLLGDNAEPGKQFFSPAYGDFVLPNAVNPPYNQAQARQLLEQVGATNINLKLVYGAKNAEDSLLVGAIQADLQAVGIGTTLVPLEDAALMKAFKEKNFDLIMLGQSFIPHNEPASHYRRGYYHPQSTYPVLTMPELTAQIEQLYNTGGAAQRNALHQAIQRQISEQMAVIVLFHRNNMVAGKKNIEGYQLSVGTWQIYRGLDKAYVK